MTALAALIWIVICSAAGATPVRWHRPIAYSLIAVSPVLVYLIARDHGGWLAAGFVAVGAFQLRLLLRHWVKRAWARLRGGADHA